MSRILLGLASLNAALLLTSMALGFLSEGRANVLPDQVLTPPQNMFALHFLIGLAATLMTLLTHCLVLTYFLGTGRWVQEVVQSYALPVSLWHETRQLKTRTLPFLLGSILFVLVAVASGAASDRGMLSGTFHLVLSLSAVAFNFWSYSAEYRAVRANGQLTDRVMGEVRRLRAERGLD